MRSHYDMEQGFPKTTHRCDKCLSKISSAETILERFREVLGGAIESSHIDRYENGKRKKKIEKIWLIIPRDRLRDAVAMVANLQSPPHLAVASGSDLGDRIEILYHFQVFWGFGSDTTMTITIGTTCPKDDPRIPTITDIVPGALITEREKQEFLGVVIENIPDSRRLFLTENVPEKTYPWRKDETGVEDMVKDVHKEGE